MKGLLLAVMVVCLLSGSSFAAEVSNNIAQWVSIQPPQPQSEEWNSANWSQHEWQVYSEQGKVHCKSYDPNQGIGDKPDFTIVQSKQMHGRNIVLMFPMGG